MPRVSDLPVADCTCSGLYRPRAEDQSGSRVGSNDLDRKLGRGALAKRRAANLGQGLCEVKSTAEGARGARGFGAFYYASLASGLEQAPQSSDGNPGQLQAERALIRSFPEGVERFCRRPWAR